MREVSRENIKGLDQRDDQNEDNDSRNGRCDFGKSIVPGKEDRGERDDGCQDGEENRSRNFSCPIDGCLKATLSLLTSCMNVFADDDSIIYD